MNDQNQLRSEPRNDCVHISRNCWDLKIISKFLFYNKISLSFDLFLSFWILEKSMLSFGACIDFYWFINSWNDCGGKFNTMYYVYVILDLIILLRSKKQGDVRKSLILQGVIILWHVTQWVFRAPPYHILPAFQNLYGRLF